MEISRKRMLQGMVGGAAVLAGADRLPRPMAAAAYAAGAGPMVWAWLLSDEPDSVASLQKQAAHITHLSPPWFSMRSDLSIVGTPDPLVVQFAARHNLALHPLINNDQYDPAVAENILATPQQRAGAAQQIAQLVLQHGFAGINVDFEGTFGAAREPFADFIEQLSGRLRPAGKWVTVDVVPHTSATSINAWAAPYDYSRLGLACDAVMLMAYDYSVQQPGSISPQWWVNQVIAFAKTKIDPAKIVVGFPFYGRHWIQANGNITTVDLNQVEAQQFHTWTGAPLVRPAQDATPRFSWRVGNVTHIVHYDDKISLAAKLQAVDPSLGGVAFWRLGLEAAHQWDVVSAWIGSQPTS